LLNIVNNSQPRQLIIALNLPAYNEVLTFTIALKNGAVDIGLR
jgi:hypothetical protein